MSTRISRPAYLSRIRRAFLLRVHPDRFPDAETRSNQANLVKALSARMGQADFSAWQQQRKPAVNISIESMGSLSYVIEKRDGSLLKRNLPLNASVENILQNIAATLTEAGVANIPESPLCTPLKEQKDEHISQNTTSADGTRTTTSQHYRYNVMSQQGRNLVHFLDTLDASEILERKASRTDAQAAAQQVRRFFQFQAVDATTLGWSSASVAVLLRRLMSLHNEHAARLHVQSFYPIRIVFSQDDFHDPLDAYGGILKLNPSDSATQWLETLRLVTPAELGQIQHYRNLLMDRTKRLHGLLGVKFKKGYSCSNQEYHYFLEQLLQSLEKRSPDSKSVTTQLQETSTALTISTVVAMVETSQACRRPIATKEGTIRLGASMTVDMVRKAIARYAHVARDRQEEHSQQLEACREKIHTAQWTLGLAKVHRSRVVSNEEFAESLGRLLAFVSSSTTDNTAHKVVTMGLGGNSLGIVGSGHFCHLADDGSLMIPHNWQ